MSMTLIDQIIRDIAELEPHSSADESHDSMLVTGSELKAILEKHLAGIGPDPSALSGFSTSGVNVFGTHDSIKTVMEWNHSHSMADGLRTNLRHWREECGKVHAHCRQMLDPLKKARQYLGGINPFDMSGGVKNDELRGQIDAAISKAEGR